MDQEPEQHNPERHQEMLMLAKLRGLLYTIGECVSQAQHLGVQINRGTAGREVALCHTKLQEAEDWAKRALKEREIASGSEFIL